MTDPKFDADGVFDDDYLDLFYGPLEERSDEIFLRRARADAADRAVSVDYVLGDMRELPWQGRFDRVVSWFTAFGYFDDAQNRQVLAEIARVLKPGGRLGIELNNYPALMRGYLPSVVTEYGRRRAAASSRAGSSATAPCARSRSSPGCSPSLSSGTGCSPPASARRPVTARTAARSLPRTAA
jgi:SAM-dependent methyltransferase